MDSNLNKNAYQPNNINRENEFYGGCMLTNPCGQQSSAQRGQHQHFLPPPYPINNAMPHQQLLYNSQGQSMYNIMYGAQPMYRNQNTFQPALAPNSSFPAPETVPSWVSESCVVSVPPGNNNAEASKEKYMKMKYENKSKDTNAASCCAPLPDVYKVNKNFYYNNKMDTQWFYGSNYDAAQKYNELPSCSQISSNNSGIRHLNECCVPSRETSAKNIKSVKYCSIQKCPDPDPKLYMYSNKYETHTTQVIGYVNQQYGNNNKIPKDYPSCSQIPETCSNAIYSTGDAGNCLEIDKKILLGPCDMGYYPENNSLQPFDVPKLDDKTEDSNGGGESDIVVEDSDEEVTDESEDNIINIQPPCFVCNTATTDSTEYCVITDKVPLTSYSHTCVSETLITLFGLTTTNFVHTANYSTYLCSTCMALINTYDNLHVQFESIKRDLINKYKATIEALKQYIEESADKHPDDGSILQQISNHNNQIAIAATSTKMNLNKQQCPARKICGSHIFKCRVCEKIFSLKKFYKFHMSKHKLRRKSFLCERCGCHFVKHSNLLAHLRRHSSSQKQFKLNCLHCRKSFVYERSLRQHKCNTSMKTSFVCHICGKIIKSSSSLKEHEYDCSGKLAYACVKCNKRFASPSKLNKHTLVDHDQKFTATCSICGKGFTKHSDYKLHTLTHSATKSFKCTVCGKTYKTLSNLNYHSKVHNATLPFSCNVCQKGFLRRENLQAHLNIHNGLKPFDCVICEKKFASQKNLDAHLKVHNGSTRKTACTVCGKQIIHGLDEHMRTHSNRKDFQCDSCDMKFYTKGALAKHKKRKHESIDVL